MRVFKSKFFYIAIIILVCSYLSFRYLEYRKNYNYLENLSDSTGIISDIDSFFLLKFSTTGELPSMAEINRYLPQVDSIFFSKENYTVKVDTSKNAISIDIHPFGKANKNQIDAKLYYDKGWSFTKDFNFINYLSSGGIYIISINNRYHYDCQDRFYYKTIFLDNKNHIVWNDKELETRLNELLEDFNLVIGYQENFSNSTILIYNNNKLKNKCPLEKWKIKDSLVEHRFIDSIKLNFPEYKFIKFAISPVDANKDK